MTVQDRLAIFETRPGFIAALDQSGGSTPKALNLYGLDSTHYSTEVEMFDLIHAARSRVVASATFTSDRILGAILFEMTMNREIEGQGFVDYLWNRKQILPFVKIDKGLEEVRDQVQIMRPNPGLSDLLGRAVEKGVFGTKERSVIHGANRGGIETVVAQQFEVAQQVLAAGLIPIVEPEVDINAADKAEAEELVKAEILKGLSGLGEQKVALKLTLPSVDNFYSDLVEHKNVARVVALSGGYSRADANSRLARNRGVIASFSRALSEGLTAQQTDTEFDTALNASIESIYQASLAG